MQIRNTFAFNRTDAMCNTIRWNFHAECVHRERWTVYSMKLKVRNGKWAITSFNLLLLVFFFTFLQKFNLGTRWRIVQNAGVFFGANTD